jgi:hypothetical protein
MLKMREEQNIKVFADEGLKGVFLDVSITAILLMIKYESV